ncbi:hypothetical protein M8831_34085, partial [Pseudomonas aeruginosa]
IYCALKQPVPAEKFIDKAAQLREKHSKIIFAEDEIAYQNSLALLYQLQGKKEQAIEVLNHTATLQKDIYQTENAQAIAE